MVFKGKHYNINSRWRRAFPTNLDSELQMPPNSNPVERWTQFTIK